MPSYRAASFLPVTALLTRTDLPLPLLRRGKVRDVYDLGDALLMVASDRVSAFDVILPQPVPRKGEVLTLLSAWWFARTRDITPNHLVSVDPKEIAARYPVLRNCRDEWAGRAMLVHRTDPYPVECVVRGYLAGSSWSEYRQSGTLAGERLPAGLVESARLETPLFSPATKADRGHDENISFARMGELLGAEAAVRLRVASLALYDQGREVCAARGILLADTKLEFGRAADGSTLLIDEAITPDSSRFWPAEGYTPGGPQPSFDKQPLRDYLEEIAHADGWNKQAPGPDLPAQVVEATSTRYQDAFRRITGWDLDQFPLDDPGGS
ncbi:phosphoribosylaminoimidazolesuccinocarboxamide synthase [soil metagenome]